MSRTARNCLRSHDHLHAKVDILQQDYTSPVQWSAPGRESCQRFQVSLNGGHLILFGKPVSNSCLRPSLNIYKKNSAFKNKVRLVFGLFWCLSEKIHWFIIIYHRLPNPKKIRAESPMFKHTQISYIWRFQIHGGTLKSAKSLDHDLVFFNNHGDLWILWIPHDLRNHHGSIISSP